MLFKYINKLEKRYKQGVLFTLILTFLIPLIYAILSKSVKVGLFVFIALFLCWLRVFYLALRYHKK